MIIFNPPPVSEVMLSTLLLLKWPLLHETHPTDTKTDPWSPSPCLSQILKRDGDKASLCYFGLWRLDRGMIIRMIICNIADSKRAVRFGLPGRVIPVLLLSRLNWWRFCWVQSQIESTVWKDIDELKVFKVLDLEDFQKTFSAYQKLQVYKSARSS